MKEWFDALPIEVALAFMWVVGIVRTSIVYALGALAAEGGARLDRIRKAMDSPLYRKARRLINRWGVIAVPLCFLTVGLQTAVIITTGFTKMPLRRWVPAMLVGTFMWACIYTRAERARKRYRPGRKRSARRGAHPRVPAPRAAGNDPDSGGSAHPRAAALCATH